MSDQLGSYSSPLQQSVNWHKKLVFELLLNTAVVNALVVNNAVNAKMQTTNFREELALSLITTTDDDVVPEG